jgi:uncharacterized protein (TIGR03067 family)
MRRPAFFLFPFLFLVLAGTLVSGKDSQPQDDDKLLMQGHWTRLYGQSGDKIVGGYEGNQWVMYGNGGCNIYKNETTEDFKIILDQTANPKRITMVFGKQVSRAIYHLDGDRMLTIPLNSAEDEWPTEFVVGPHQLLLVDKRIAAKS